MTAPKLKSFKTQLLCQKTIKVTEIVKMAKKVAAGYPIAVLHLWTLNNNGKLRVRADRLPISRASLMNRLLKEHVQLAAKAGRLRVVGVVVIATTTVTILATARQTTNDADQKQKIKGCIHTAFIFLPN